MSRASLGKIFSGAADVRLYLEKGPGRERTATVEKSADEEGLAAVGAAAGATLGRAGWQGLGPR